MSNDTVGTLFRLTPEDSRVVANESMLLELFGPRSEPEGNPEADIAAVIARALATYPSDRRVDLGWRWSGIARAFSKWGLPDVFGALDVRPAPIGDWMFGVATKARVTALAHDLATSDVEAGILRVEPDMPLRDKLSDLEKWRAEPNAVHLCMRATLEIFARAARDNEAVLFVYT